MVLEVRKQVADNAPANSGDDDDNAGTYLLCASIVQTPGGETRGLPISKFRCSKVLWWCVDRMGEDRCVGGRSSEGGRVRQRGHACTCICTCTVAGWGPCRPPSPPTAGPNSQPG